MFIPKSPPTIYNRFTLRSTSDQGSGDPFNKSGSIFAGLSVLLGALALLIGLLQLRKHRQRQGPR
ncbi:hypothetical protein T440DRAFT_471666 [Plenodomus tracheiphilus IPT5]|uniref:Uncharacterized protein n=1 Tax=Plenodomus tracheiphilus IPT5 TaxID=1408161 RepID=A0A6A7AU42_9PLEO|nr:hypothetical protein T440DRAFT_471666 [Plenodomus tracheiphilus IPT5]